MRGRESRREAVTGQHQLTNARGLRIHVGRRLGTQVHHDAGRGPSVPGDRGPGCPKNHWERIGRATGAAA